MKWRKKKIRNFTGISYFKLRITMDGPLNQLFSLLFSVYKQIICKLDCVDCQQETQTLLRHVKKGNRKEINESKMKKENLLLATVFPAKNLLQAYRISLFQPPFVFTRSINISIDYTIANKKKHNQNILFKSI